MARQHRVEGYVEDGFGWVFTTVVLHRSPNRRSATAGFICLWEHELTFVKAQLWIRLVMPVIGLPRFVRPRGPDDSRTTVRVKYSELIRVRPHGAWIAVEAPGATYEFTGAGYNSRFGFQVAAAEIAGALEHAGYRVSVDTAELRVLGRSDQPTPQG